MSAEPSTIDRPVIEPGHYREVLGHYPTGVSVVTGVSADGEPIGMVVGTFSSVSLDPPLVAFMPTVSSGTFALMRDSAAYCVNVLAHDQIDLCRVMAVPRRGKFDGVRWSMSSYGAPVLHDAVAHVHCRAQEVVEAGDHLIVLCAVEAMEVARPVTPLLFFQGGYGGFSPKGMAAKGDAEVIAAVRRAEVARPQVERLARTLRAEIAVLAQVNDHELTKALAAVGPGVAMQEQLGERIPLIPPLGEAFVAWSSQAPVEAWLGRISQPTAELVDRFRRRLDDVRARGFAVSRLCAESASRYAALTSAMREYAAGELTPARERAVRAVIADAAQFFETVDIAADDSYDIGAVVVPVLGADGNAVLCLRATQLQQGVTGLQVSAWIATLQEAAGAVAAALAGPGDTHAAYFGGPTGDFML